jgi:molybdate-binding protein/DNA-binding XRE family transcriptional regulator
MAHSNELQNRVRAYRQRLGLSQDELARRSGLSRAGISAVETNRLVPSTVAALALAATLGCRVEDLFFTNVNVAAELGDAWAWSPPKPIWRYWKAEVGGQVRLYPVEASPQGAIPHDGLFESGVARDSGIADARRTLVMASCDPAAGLLAAELAQTEKIRLIVLPRSSRAALDLLQRGLVHLAGIHLSRSNDDRQNETAVANLATTHREFEIVRMADWEEGVALSPTLRLSSIAAVLHAGVNWIGREPGSGARECLDEILEPRGRRSRTKGALPEARDHRGVADAIRCGWAQAGVCLRLTADEAGLDFLSVRQEPYDLCFDASAADDARLKALLRVIRSANFRRQIGELPGYDTSRSGEHRRVRSRTRPDTNTSSGQASSREVP